MQNQIIGIVIMVLGALLTFLSNVIAKKVWKIENPKESLKALVLKFIGLGIAVLGMLFIMDVIVL